MQHAATVVDADLSLLLLVDTIEGGKVDVRGCLVNVDVVVIGSEDAGERKGVSREISLTPVTRGNSRVNDEGGEREHQGRETCRMRLELNCGEDVGLACLFDR